MNLDSLPYVEDIHPFLKGANHIDVKSIDGNVSLREFIASMMSYAPWWLVLLYKIRAVVARVLGLEKQPERVQRICLAHEQGHNGTRYQDQIKSGDFSIFPRYPVVPLRDTKTDRAGNEPCDRRCPGEDVGVQPVLGCADPPSEKDLKEIS